MIQRELTKVYTPAREAGFLGAGHTARMLLTGSFADTDPFIVLMDDDLDKKDYSPAGGPHPHAGFETVSLLVDGEIAEVSETMKKGDFQIMTAGSGIIHTDTINAPTKGRLFQLWLNLPQKDRWTTPRVQDLPAAHVPTSAHNGVSIRLYSGQLDGLSSPVLNHTPLLVAEITMEPGSSKALTIPAHFNAFLVILSGSVAVGKNQKGVTADQVAWLTRQTDDAQSELLLTTAREGARLVLYAATPTGDKIVSHGPFIADKEEEIQPLYQLFRRGKMQHISTTLPSQRITY